MLKSVKTPTMPRKPTKLGVDFTGPWEVLEVHSNDYTCVHVTERDEKVFHVDMLEQWPSAPPCWIRICMLWWLFLRIAETHEHLWAANFCYTMKTVAICG